MADPDRLCVLLGEEAALCSALAEVLREQQQAIIALAPTTLLACLERREALAHAVLAAGQLRAEALRTLCLAHGIDADRPEHVLPRLPAVDRMRLRSALGRLREALTTVRSLERQTAQLVEGSLAHVRELVRTLAGLVPSARYGADAELAAPASAEWLDRRA